MKAMLLSIALLAALSLRADAVMFSTSGNPPPVGFLTGFTSGYIIGFSSGKIQCFSC